MSDALRDLNALIDEAIEAVDENPRYIAKILNQAFLLGVERNREMQKEDAERLSKYESTYMGDQ